MQSERYNQNHPARTAPTFSLMVSPVFNQGRNQCRQHHDVHTAPAA